ncbi:MAG: DUF5688 family protein [Lachnospiraceae bacterium]|nr:DUF5688 family protein [Lachnospiraceae bacterium]
MELKSIKTKTLNYQCFEKELMEEVSRYIGNGYRAHIVNIEKLNTNPQPAIVLQKMDQAQSSSPAFYLDSKFDAYNAGTPIATLAAGIVRDYCADEKKVSYDARKYLQYEEIKEKIICRLYGCAKNDNLLRQVPHKEILSNLVVVFYCEIDADKSILIRNNHINIWGIEDEELFETALANTRRMYPPRIVPLYQCLEEIMDLSPELLETKDAVSAYILTNERCLFGAVDILYDDVLSAVCRRLGSEKVYLLPSSIHEWIVLGAARMNPSALRQIVSEINEKYVSAEDVLIDAVYSYEMYNKRLSIEA